PALMDVVLVVVSLYDVRGVPFALNGRARELCRLPLADELERARKIAEIPAHAATLERVLKNLIQEELPLELPWATKGPKLRARWLAIAAPNGDPQVALVVEPDAEPLREALGTCLRKLRDAGAALGKTELARESGEAADLAEERLLAALPRPEEIEVVELGALCRTVRDEIVARTNGQLRIELDLPQPAVSVVEARGRAGEAIRRL